MSGEVVRNRTATIINTVLHGGGRDPTSAAEEIVKMLTERQLVYPSRADNVRRAVMRGFRTPPNPSGTSTENENIPERILLSLITSGEIIGSWR